MRIYTTDGVVAKDKIRHSRPFRSHFTLFDIVCECDRHCKILDSDLIMANDHTHQEQQQQQRQRQEQSQ